MTSSHTIATVTNNKSTTTTKNAPKSASRDKVSSTGDKNSVTTDGDFDVYNMEASLLPTMDWERLETELKRAAEEENRKKVSVHVNLEMNLIIIQYSQFN
jgi:hypothetical protein